MAQVPKRVQKLQKKNENKPFIRQTSTARQSLALLKKTYKNRKK